jgi:phospholipid-transporting ATPase
MESKLRVVKVNEENLKTKYLCCRRRKWRLCSYKRPLYPTNKISTSKYNLLTFLPLNLLLQFSKGANLYFLMLLIMELIPPITDSNGPVPGLALPLSFVVGLSMIKDIYEDVMRHISDNQENSRRTKASTRRKRHN